MVCVALPVWMLHHSHPTGCAWGWLSECDAFGAAVLVLRWGCSRSLPCLEPPAQRWQMSH